MFLPEKIKAYFSKLLHSHASPEEVAQGFALGVFISMTPTLGLHMVLAIVFAAILKKNEIAAFMGVWVVNPLTMFPIYYFIYRTGRLVLGKISPVGLKPESIRDFFHLSGDILFPLWVGGIIVGLISALLGYYAVKWAYPGLKSRMTRKPPP